MRKLLILIAFLPLVAAIGHDVYQFVQNKEKGFRFSDVGWLWEKYDPQSHQQVREELNTLMQQAEENREPEMIAEPIEESVPPSPVPQATDLPPQTTENQPLTPEPSAAPVPAPAPQTSEVVDDGTGKVKVIVKKKDALPKSTEVLGNAAGFAAFLMQQKAVVVAGGFAALMMLLMWIFGSVKLSRKKGMDEDDILAPHKKGGNYKYSRK